MQEKGYDRDQQQCRIKAKKAREANSRSTAKPQTCRCYKQLHTILGRGPTTPQTTIDTSEESESQAPAVNSKEEDGGYATVDCSYAMILDLFEIPVQSSQSQLSSVGEPDAGEGASAISLQEIVIFPTALLAALHVLEDCVSCACNAHDNSA
ncbi:hypothetical protein UY3_17827 [Chelonia mydas]|uniref:Uncharacterized protein n=1 Tax=Chelonia mydas TaxID=8469 RepID=M7AJ92_CHEMY|nr:hypothetical protein UY3_17827 [Chelonia mydas]